MKITILFTIVFLSINTLIAQKKIPDSLNTPKKRAAILSKQMKKELQLNEYQYKKTDSLNIVYAYKIEHEVIKSTRSNWGKYWKIQSIMNEKEIYLRRFLNNDQLERYKKMRNKAMNNILRNAF